MTLIEHGIKVSWLASQLKSVSRHIMVTFDTYLAKFTVRLQLNKSSKLSLDYQVSVIFKLSRQSSCEYEISIKS